MAGASSRESPWAPGPSSPSSAMAMPRARILPEAKWRPLEGVRVIDITHVLAGPWLTRVLAEQGADVISIRNPVL